VIAIQTHFAIGLCKLETISIALAEKNCINGRLCNSSHEGWAGLGCGFFAHLDLEHGCPFVP